MSTAFTPRWNPSMNQPNRGEARPGHRHHGIARSPFGNPSFPVIPLSDAGTSASFRLIPLRGAPMFPGERLDEVFRPLEEGELDLFLGSLVKSVSRTVSNVARDVGKVASKVGKAVTHAPIIGDIAKTAWSGIRLAGAPITFAVETGQGLAHGKSLGKAMGAAGKGLVNDVRDQLKVAEMVAPFIPGIGTGVAAALGAANALASGRPITEALVAGVRSALPGGAIVQAGFDMAVNLAKGKSFTEAALSAARDRLPGGPAARAAFDTAVALAHGKRLQDAALQGAKGLLPPSPLAANAVAFAQRVASGQNIQRAALSTAGRAALAEANKRLNALTREFELDVPTRGDRQRSLYPAFA
ncbi:hypothetical protein [Caballeronia sp. LZ035]|uniref:hypothetical protein n=1 Tax=Caballeronia sp. LZ035 TaxID=3038568 RepID=UPI0028585090|nr:hypothetical protein [Caballeronia sp. LZ035]MDR5757120.1 hypothetical protein [Caballeronia sp. LZ035]